MSLNTTCGGEEKDKIAWKVALMWPKYVKKKRRRRKGGGVVEVGDAFT